MSPSVPTARLKAYEPIERFSPREREAWRDAVTSAPGAPRAVLVSRRGISGALATAVARREEADALERDRRTLVCPHRTRLRLVTSILAFGRSVPAGAHEAFFEEGELERAAAALERLRAEHPDWRVHILESTWDVPLHWFVLFDDSERSLVNEDDLSTIRYETPVAAARARVDRALEVLRRMLPNLSVIGAVAGLGEWTGQFDQEGIVVLEYGTVGRLFSQAELQADRSCRQVWGALAALADKDLERATAFYQAVAERWAARRVRASAN